MENTPQQLPQIVEEKRLAWANAGQKAHYTELELKQLVENGIKKLIPPTTIEQIQETDDLLAASKKALSEVKEKRMSITNVFRDVTNRLMVPEKEFEAAFAPIEAAQLKLKQEKANGEKLQQAKKDELKRLKESLINYIIDSSLVFKKAIQERCTKSYEHALGKGNVTIETLESYLVKIKASITAPMFDVAQPTLPLSQVTQEELTKLWVEVKPMLTPANDYLESFHKQLEEKFAFYEIALKNKEQAIAHQRAEDESAKEALEKETANKQIAASMTAMATSYEASPEQTTKGLKEVYELDMEENNINMLLIVAAFTGNYDVAKEYVRVKNAFSLNIGQMGAALVAMKNKDNAFKTTGIKFKLTQKL